MRRFWGGELGLRLYGFAEVQELTPTIGMGDSEAAAGAGIPAIIVSK